MRTTWIIQNLKCGGCERTIIRKLGEIGGIKDVQIHPEDSSVTFSYHNPEQLDMVRDVLFKLGYPVLGEKNSLRLKARSYVSCATGRLNKA
ncbi:MAG: heavy-metal-associated domain-containing protein [Bacteroidota bacterium]